MSKSIKTLAFLLLLALQVPLSLSLNSQEKSAREQKTVFSLTQELLEAYYPEIFGKGWYIAYSTGQPVDDPFWGDLYGFEFNVSRFSPGLSWNARTDPTGKLVPPSKNSIFLEGSSWIDYHGDGRIHRVIFEGDLAYSPQNKTIRELVESHPEWSEEQANHALKEAGARFGPAEKQQFVDSLHLERAEKILGHLRIKLVEFQVFSNPDHVGSFASLFWVVHAEGEIPDGTHRTYGLVFEPFKGKLTDIHEMPSPK
jgi:hypothetical protein